MSTYRLQHRLSVGCKVGSGIWQELALRKFIQNSGRKYGVIPRTKAEKVTGAANVGPDGPVRMCECANERLWELDYLEDEVFFYFFTLFSFFFSERLCLCDGHGFFR